MLARVKQNYTAGSVIAFSGREYIRAEWREVPAGFEEQAKKHELLDTQPSLEEIRLPAQTGAQGLKAAEIPQKVTAEDLETRLEPPAEEPVSIRGTVETAVSEEPVETEEPTPAEEPVVESEEPEEKSSRRSSRKSRT